MLRTAKAIHRLPLLCIAILCMAAAGSTPRYSLIVGPSIELGPLQGVPSNIGYSSVSGLIDDVNGDGAPDIVVGINGTAPAVYLNNGTDTPFAGVKGLFVTPPPATPQAPISYGAVAIADVDGDGHPDLAIAGFNAPTMIYLNNGTASPFAHIKGIGIGTGDVGYVPAFGDVNGDGFPDMVVANSNHVPSRLYLTKGLPLSSGVYTTLQLGTDLGYGQDAKIADVNGDGKPDIILSYVDADLAESDPTGIAIYLNNGTSDPFSNVTPLRLLMDRGNDVDAIAVSDLNGDGKMDLVAVVSNASLTLNKLYVFLNTGSASQPFASTLTLQPDSDLGGGCLGVTVADVNGDGLPDLLFSCVAPLANVSPTPANPAVGAIYLNNGSANPFANVMPSDIPATTQSGYGRSVAVGTLVKNGTPDVLVIDEEPGLAAYHATRLDQDPVARDDSVIDTVDESTQINVLQNDSAASGESLSVGSVVITSTTQHGTAAVNTTTGLISYAPAAGFTGRDGFKYTVRDSIGGISNVASVSITVQPVVPAPVFFPAGGAYSAPVSVAIGDSVGGATIYYTTNGSTPTIASAKYVGPISVTSSETVNAVAVAAGYTTSAIASATYSMTPSLKLSAASLSFANQVVNTRSVPQTVAVTNTGNSTMTLSSISLTGSQAHDFAMTKTCSSTLAAGASCSVSVAFTPLYTGSKLSSVSISNSGGGSPQTVTLSGTSIAATAPAVTLSASALTFANQVVHTSSAPQTITVTNSGNASLSLNAIALTGSQAHDFAMTKTCGSTLAGGASCTISVAFTPLYTGTKLSSVKITDNASGSPQVVSLSGTSTASD